MDATVPRGLRNAPSAHLAAVAARDTSRANSLEPVRAYSDYATPIDDESIDAVYIALANDQHAPWIDRVIDAGEHALCEKPRTLAQPSMASRKGTIASTLRWVAVHFSTSASIHFMR